MRIIIPNRQNNPESTERSVYNSFSYSGLWSRGTNSAGQGHFPGLSKRPRGWTQWPRRVWGPGSWCTAGRRLPMLRPHSLPGACVCGSDRKWGPGGGPHGCPGTLHHGRHRRAPWNIQHEKPEWLIRVIRGAHSRPPSTGASCSLLTPAALWGPCELPEKMAPLPRWRSCRVRSSPVDTDSEASTKVTKIWSVRPYG